MAARALRSPETSGLLPAKAGHVARGSAPPVVPDGAIEAYPERVVGAFERTRATGREHGFLAYAPDAPGLPFVAEPDAVGGRRVIRWRWEHPEATVAFSFHTHPSPDALCSPSGIDALGALVRGEHVVYVLTMDGRLSGWRFREPAGRPRVVLDAIDALDEAGRFGSSYVDFLYDAFDALRDDLMAPAYAARVVDGRIVPTRPTRAFFVG